MKNFLILVILSLLRSTVASAETLWDSWYTVTLNGRVPYGYYNDKVERKEGKIFFKQSYWKMEEGFINEEQVVAIGADDDGVTPLFFNYHETYRDSEIALDGSVKTQNSISTLNVKVRQNGKEAPPIQRIIPTKAFFTTLFQVWLAKRLKTVKEGPLTGFTTLSEDALKEKFSPTTGSFRVEKADAYANQTHTRKLAMNFHDVKSIWYVHPSGETQKIEMTDQHAVYEKSTESIARKFLIKRDSD